MHPVAGNDPRGPVLPTQHGPGEEVVGAATLTERIDVNVPFSVAGEYQAPTLVEERLEPDLELQCRSDGLGDAHDLPLLLADGAQVLRGNEGGLPCTSRSPFEQDAALEPAMRNLLFGPLFLPTL